MSEPRAAAPTSPTETTTLQRALLAAPARAFGELSIFARPGRVERRPWAAVLEGAAGIARGLRAAGVEPGDRVAIVLPTCFEFVESFFGVLLAGAVPTPLYPPVRLGRLGEYHEATARMLIGAGARLVLTDRLLYGLLGRAVEKARPALGCQTVGQLAAAGRGAADPLAGLHAGAPDELALVQFSSGTTVDPKPVALSHRNVLANVQSIAADIFPGGYAGNAGVSWLPLYHDLGLIGFLFSAVVAAGPLTLIRPEQFVARPILWLQAITETRATISAAPNFAYGLCLERIRDEDLAGIDLSTWRLALTGAEPVQAGTIDRFVERFSKVGFRREAFVPVYGLSEASLAVTFSPPEQAPRAVEVDADALARGRVEAREGGRRIVSVGRPLPGMEVELRGEDGAALGQGRVGRIFARGPSIMTGYLDRPELTAAALRDGWLDTGDLGFWHEGELHVCGRAKDVIILNGKKYDPQTVEQALDGVEGLRIGCSAAFSVEQAGAPTETLCVLAERARACREPIEALAERARRAVVQRTGLVPGRVVVLDPGTLPRTSSGKIRRGRARALLLEERLAPPAGGGIIDMMRAQWDGYRAHRVVSRAVK